MLGDDDGMVGDVLRMENFRINKKSFGAFEKDDVVGPGSGFFVTLVSVFLSFFAYTQAYFLKYMTYC